MTDPAATGARVLEALAAGQALAIERARQRAADRARPVRAELDIDLLQDRAAWGRAGRIAKRLRLPRRTVQKYLAAFSSAASFPLPDTDTDSPAKDRTA